jgi:hypothetical protein
MSSGVDPSKRIVSEHQQQVWIDLRDGGSPQGVNWDCK